MRLSEAMMLGDSLRTRSNCMYLECESNPPCGCAIGGATLAMGRTGNEDHSILWPWLSANRQCYDGEISVLFDRVMAGNMTFEQLVDYVRSIEPECGECNQFICSCVQKMDELQPQHVYAEA